MIVKAILLNPNLPHAQPVEVSFPTKDYDELYQKLDGSGIGDVLKRDCRVADIGGAFEALVSLKGQDVNIDELDYLAKRLESFFAPEAMQFEGSAAAIGISDIESLINLSFCCQQTTVITDFSDLRAVGRDHYMNINGGGAPVSELDSLDSERVARDLIQNEAGTVTPYGVFYRNGMEIERLYKGQVFPEYLYDHCLFAVAVKNDSEPDIGSTWLHLPMPDVCMERALVRGGLSDPSDISSLDSDMLGLTTNVFRMIDTAYESPQSLNNAAKAIAELDDYDMKKFYAAVEYIEPRSATALRGLATHLDYFDFYPGVHNAEEYGRYMIIESGHFEYDAEIDEFYDFEKYGNWRLEYEQGRFLESGYISYNGEAPLEALFSEPDGSQDQGMKMGGM